MSGRKFHLFPALLCNSHFYHLFRELTKIFESVRFLDLIKPFTPLLPEVASPETKTPFQQVCFQIGSRFIALQVLRRTFVNWANLTRDAIEINMDRSKLLSWNFH